MARTEDIILVEALHKSFGGHKAVDDLSFSVSRGETFAFLGANGSGKTTTIRCLLGIYPIDSGRALIDGQPYHPGQNKLLGYLPEERGLYLNSLVGEVMELFGRLRGLTQSEAKKRTLSYLEMVELPDKYQAKIKSLSSGQQQKIQLGLAILHRPPLLILDEPTKGLDPLNRQVLMNILFELQKQGTTIVFTTHQMEEVEKIADRLVMIDGGQRVLYGSLSQVKNDFGTNVIHLNYSGKLPANQKLYSARVRTNQAELTPAPGVDPSEILSFLVAKKLVIEQFRLEAPSLDEIFNQVVKQKRKAGS